MRPWGRVAFALAGLTGATALLPGVSTAGHAEVLKTEVELTTRDVGSKESNLSDVVADALRAVAKSDAAIIPAPSFVESTTVPKGVFKAGDLMAAVKESAEDVFVVKLTGDQITRAFEQSLFIYPKANAAFLQVSGFAVSANPSAPAGKRVVSIKVGGEALEPGKTYRVAMPAILANGGLTYFKIWKKSDIDKDTNKSVEAAVTGYLADHHTITKGDDRLVFKGK